MSNSCPINLPLLRKLLMKALPCDADLEAFCIDYFPAVHQRYSSGMNRQAKINLLFQYTAPVQIYEALSRQTSGMFLQEGSAERGDGGIVLAPQIIAYGKVLPNAKGTSRVLIVLIISASVTILIWAALQKFIVYRHLDREIVPSTDRVPISLGLINNTVRSNLQPALDARLSVAASPYSAASRARVFFKPMPSM